MTTFLIEVLRAVRDHPEKEHEWVAFVVGSSASAVGRATMRLSALDLLARHGSTVGHLTEKGRQTLRELDH